MTASTVPFRTPYELRVSLVAAALTENSAITATAADGVAEKVLRALDHIPEKVR